MAVESTRATRRRSTIMEMSRCLMIDAGLPHEYWQYAAAMAAYIRNRTPTSSNKENMSPFEVLWEKKPDLCTLPLFGARAQVHVPDALRGSWMRSHKTASFSDTLMERRQESRARRYEEAIHISGRCRGKVSNRFDEQGNAGSGLAAQS